MGSGLGAPLIVGSAAKSGSPGNTDLLSRGRCVGATRDAMELRVQAVCEGTWGSVGQAGDGELRNRAFLWASSVVSRQRAVARRRAAAVPDLSDHEEHTFPAG